MSAIDMAMAATGATFRNGIDGLHCTGANWGALMTVVRIDPNAYGTTRFIVADANGRRGYAFGAPVTD